MPYSQEISRQNKACFLFLLDQSYSMTEPLANGQRTKKQDLALAINNWINNAAIRATGGSGVKDWMDIGVIGYRTDPQANPIVGPTMQGPLAGRNLVSIVEIADNPCRIADEMQVYADPATGELIQNPAGAGLGRGTRRGAPICTTLHLAYTILDEWIQAHPKSYPPIVINITDGESSEGDPLPYTDAIKSLATEDGNVLLFNCHLSMTPADPFMFPSSDELLPDEFARGLFRMSSPLPETIYQRAMQEGLPLQPGARGMVFNADMVCLIKFLDMGTRVASSLR